MCLTHEQIGRLRPYIASKACGELIAIRTGSASLIPQKWFWRQQEMEM